MTSLLDFGFPKISENLIGFCTYQCPYCLFTSKAKDNFLLLDNNERPSKSLGLCPKCHNRVKYKTLLQTADYSIEEYAYWVHDVREYDVNHRLKWGEIKAQLRNAGLVTKFWESYYKRKLEIHPEFKSRIRENSTANE